MKKLILFALIFTIIAAASGCKPEDKEDDAEKVTIVLDWDINTNHTGLYVAQNKGFFDELGLYVDIKKPPEDGALSLLAAGRADFAISFQDIIATAISSDSPLPVTAVAAVIQHNTSGIISKKSDGITNFKAMEGKVYATWDDPIEQAIISHCVTQDGGDFEKVTLVPSVTDVITALKANINTVWVYYAWDGVATQVEEMETNYLPFKDKDAVLDYYTPVIAGNDDYLKDHPETAKKFLAACKKGYEYAIDHPDEAAEILCSYAEGLDLELVKASQQYLKDQYKAEVARWGYIDETRWNNFFSWLYENELVDTDISGKAFTNDFLPK